MSTTYFVCDHDELGEFSADAIAPLVAANGWTIEIVDDGHAILDTGGNWLHIHGNEFVRYGGNDAEPLIEALEEADWAWTDEYQ